MDDETDVRTALKAFDRAFAAGEADALAALFTDDAQLLLLHREPIVGREAIRAEWTRAFGEWDPGAWQAEQPLVEVRGDRAHVLSIYAETLLQRSGPASVDVRGRVVFFLRRDPDGAWRISLAMNSHSRPMDRRDGGSG